MILEIHGLTEFLFLDIILLWFFVSFCIIDVIMMFGFFFMDSGVLTINESNIIKKIIKLKKTDKHLYNFANKLDKDNYRFLTRYKMLSLDRVVLTSSFNQRVKSNFINDNEKRLYEKIESIIYYYDFIHRNK